jgi:hypothetical protein
VQAPTQNLRFDASLLETLPRGRTLRPRRAPPASGARPAAPPERRLRPACLQQPHRRHGRPAFLPGPSSGTGTRRLWSRWATPAAPSSCSSVVTGPTPWSLEAPWSPRHTIGTEQATQIELPPDYLGRVKHGQSLDSAILLDPGHVGGREAGPAGLGDLRHIDVDAVYRRRHTPC